MFKKNTAVTGFIVGLVSKTDGSDITTGTPVGYYTLDGGTQTAIGDVTPTHEGNGEWSFDLLAAEMNGDVVGLTFTHTSAITVHFTIKTDTKVVSELQDIAAGALMGLANGAITALKFGAGAIDAAAISADFTDEVMADWEDGGRLDLILDIIAADTTTDIPALIAALNDVSAADVLTQVNAALDTVISELGIGTPATTPTLRTGLMLLYMSLLNKQDTTGSSNEIHNAAGTVIADAVLADDTVLFSKAKYIAP